MKKIKTLTTKASLVALILSQAAHAAAVNVHEYTPAANPAYVFSEDALSSSLWGAKGEGRVFFGATYDMVNDPIVELDSKHSKRTGTIVESMHSMNLSFGYSIISRVQVGASTSMTMVRFPDHHSEFGLGDSRLFTKLRLNDENAAVAFALMPELYIPTGKRSLYLSDDSFGAGLRFIAEHDFGPVAITGNAGFRHSPNAEYRDLNKRSAIPLSLGLLIPIGPRWAINTEATGEVAVPFNSYQNPSALYAGMRYRLPADFIVSFGGAVGSVNNYSSADFRIIAGITVMPQGKKEVIVEEAPKPMPVAVVQAPAPVVQKPRVVFTAKQIEISEEVKFEHAKARLTASGQNLLDEVAKVMKDNDKYFSSVVVEGHTNELGSFKYNQVLSEQRAAAVKEYLVSRGVKGSKLKTIGYGKTHPKVLKTDGLSLEARLAANRRVEFKVINGTMPVNPSTIGVTAPASTPVVAAPAATVPAAPATSVTPVVAPTASEAPEQMTSN